MQENYGVGNAQTIGDCEIQSNYFSCCCNSTTFAVLADGNLDHINGRNAAILAVETSVWEYNRKPTQRSMEEFYDTLAMQIIRNIRDRIYLGKKPNVSICIACIKQEMLYYFTVGDNRIGLARGQNYQQLNDRNGQCKIKSTDRLVLMSKGIYEALNEVELLAFLSKQLDPFDKTQQIITEVNKKNIKNAKNATIILIEGKL